MTRSSPPDQHLQVFGGHGPFLGSWPCLMPPNFIDAFFPFNASYAHTQKGARAHGSTCASTHTPTRSPVLPYVSSHLRNAWGRSATGRQAGREHDKSAFCKLWWYAQIHDKQGRARSCSNKAGLSNISSLSNSELPLSLFILMLS